MKVLKNITSSIVAPQLRKPKVLIVESDSLSAQQYYDFFALQNIDATIASGAADAIAAADEEQFDAVIVELQLIGHNGVEFLYEFRSYADFNEIPIILYTVVPPERLPEKELRETFNVVGILYKPTTPLANLAREIKKHVRT